MPPAFQLRAVVEPDDTPFLAALYAAGRDWEMAAVPWTDEQKAVFLAQQFQWQCQGYARTCPNAERNVIVVGNENAGRLYVDRSDHEIRVVDIALMPAFRNLGIGGALLRRLQDEAATSGRFLSIHVEKTNPARRLYDRLGFMVETDREVYDFMVWRAA